VHLGRAEMPPRRGQMRFAGSAVSLIRRSSAPGFVWSTDLVANRHITHDRRAQVRGAEPKVPI
jgi:hypothetical protein